MSFLKKFFSEINPVSYCKKTDLPLWQCPQFLFVVMGIIIIVSSLSIYFIGLHYISQPEIVLLIVLVVSGLLFLISFLIIKSFEKLAEANRLKSEFINLASHELRAPLTNLSWGLEVFESQIKEKLQSEEKDYLKILKENILSMQDIVSQLLTVSRIESSALVFQKEEFSLEEFTKKIIEDYAKKIKDENIEIVFNPPSSSLPKVFGDKNQISLIIKHLLENALIFTKPKLENALIFTKPKIKRGERGKITINLFRQRNKIIFLIEDNGLGIKKEEQKYVFQKFFRPAIFKEDGLLGFGLNLYIAKGIVLALGEKIGFKSQEGQGSSFWFTLSGNNLKLK